MSYVLQNGRNFRPLRNLKEAYFLESSVILGAFVTFLIGFLIAYGNYLLIRKGSGGTGGFTSFLPLLRMVISAAYLAAVYLLAPLTPCDPIWLLAGAAAGLTVPMFFFTFLLLRHMKAAGNEQETDNHTKSGKGGDA